MSASAADTIVAAATPWGRGALAIVRISGPEALQVADQLCGRRAGLRPRRASLRVVRDADGQVLDELLLTFFPGPASATGEDVVELTPHGNPVIVAALVDACVAAGARPAGAGEFTRRALVNGRVDLLGAEAVDAVVRSATLAGVRLAGSGGGLPDALAVWRATLLDLAAELEAGLDYPGEELGRVADQVLVETLEDLQTRVGALAATWGPARARLEGARVALVGAVNAGKSSLFNALLAEQRALVSEEAGTTRDVVEARVELDGLALTFLDTAGHRADASPLERAGLELARRRLDQVDLVLLLTRLDRAPDPIEASLRARLGERPLWTVGTHLDRVPRAPRPVDHAVSSTTGQGVDALRQALRRSLGDLPLDVQAVLLSERQHGLVVALRAHLDQAVDALLGVLGPAVAAEELHQALGRLDELSGADTREDVLDQLFARFCIGK